VARDLDTRRLRDLSRRFVGGDVGILPRLGESASAPRAAAAPDLAQLCYIAAYNALNTTER
jgi:hypothetical protein